LSAAFSVLDSRSAYPFYSVWYLAVYQVKATAGPYSCNTDIDKKATRLSHGPGVHKKT